MKSNISSKIIPEQKETKTESDENKSELKGNKNNSQISQEKDKLISEEKVIPTENVILNSEFKNIEPIDLKDEKFHFSPEQFPSNIIKGNSDWENCLEKIEFSNFDLDDYLKDCIEDLENFSSFITFEDLIVDSRYTFKLLMKSLQKIINFNYFYVKFSVPKLKSNMNEEKKMKKKTDFEDKKSLFLDKLYNRTSNIKNDKIINIDDSDSITKKSISSSNEKKSKNHQSSNKINKTESKIEEYENMKSILSIINFKANTEEEDLVDGKSYEIKVKKYFQTVLEICSEKSYSVYSNSSKPIQGFYKFYENLQKEVKEKLNIYGNSNDYSEYNKLEFDLMVNNVNGKVIKKIIDIFKSSIIAKKWEENEEEYQILGEIAKNILNQSIDKFKQIKKIVDILSIDKILNKELLNNSNELANNLINEYSNLKLDVSEKKFLFIFTDGCFLELKKAILFEEKELNKSQNYNDVKIKTLFPLINKQRYVKNMIYLNKIIELLNESGIPYIIFYVGEELNNKIEKTLINHIKKNNNKSEYNNLIIKLQNNEKLISNNISQSFIIKTINQKLKELNKNKIFDIIKSIVSTIPSNNINKYYQILVENIIDNKNENNDKLIFLIFIISDESFPRFEDMINDYNKYFSFILFKLITTKKDNFNKEYNDYIKNKNLKIFKTIIFSDENEFNTIVKDYIENDFIFENILEMINFNPISIVIKSILHLKVKNYIFSHFLHFTEEKYLNIKNLHKKIIYDLNQMKDFMPIKIKNSNNDDIFIKELSNCIYSNKEEYMKLIESKSNEILKEIKKTVGKEIYDYLIIKKEKLIIEKIKKNLQKIIEHISCFSIYEKLFLKYFEYHYF